MAAKYICIEGVEGVGKTTQTKKLVEYLQSQGKKVLQTKEPGTPLSPLTMELRNIMLNSAYDSEITVLGRELVSQAIRSVHIEKIIKPALEEYDYIVQDRGLLSGLSYGRSCGNDYSFLQMLSEKVARPLGASTLHGVYDRVVFLTSKKVQEKLELAKNTKQEFESGDAIEAKGSEFMLDVNLNMHNYCVMFNTVKIDIDDKSIEQVFEEILLNI